MRRAALFLWLALAALLVPSGPAAAQDSEAGLIGRQIENALSGPGREARVTGFRGALSGRATLERLTFADADGVWLTLEDAVLDWNRAALLRGRLSVDELSAERIVVARAPLPAPPTEGAPAPPQAEASGFALPELPVTINVQEFRIDELILGAPLLGEQVRFTADGAIRLEGGEGDVQLSLERQDGREDAIRLEAGFDNETRILSLDLSVREGAGGLAGTLLDLPGAPELALDVAGTGPLDDYTADVSLETNGTERMGGQITLSGTEGGGIAFAADLGGDLTPLLPAEIAGFFGDDIRLVADGTRADNGALTVETLEIGARSLQLSGSLALSAEGVPQSFALSARLADPAGGPVRLPTAAPVTLGQASLTAQFDAAEGEVWTLDLSVEDLVAEETRLGALTLEGGGSIATGGGPLRVTADLDYAARGLTLPDAALSEALGDEIGGRARLAWTEGAPLEVAELILGGADYGLEASGAADFAERTLRLDGEAALSADDLSRFSALAGRPLTGEAEVTLAGEGDVLGGLFDVTLDLSGEGLSVGQEVADRFLDGPVTLSAAARRDREGTVLERFALDSTGVTAEASGRVGSGEGDLTFDVALADLSLIAPDLEGPIRVAGGAEEVSEGLWRTEVDIEGAYGLAGTVEGQVGTGPAAGQTDVALDLSLPDIAPLVPTLSGPVSVAGTAQEAAAGLFEVDLTVDGPAGTRAEVAGRVGADTDVALQVEVPDIGAFAEGVPGAATLEGQVTQYAPGGYAVDLAADLPFDATARLEGRVGASRSALSYRATIPDLGAVSPAIAGPAIAEGRIVQLPSGRIEVTADAEGPYDATADVNALLGAGRDGTGRLEAEAAVRLPDLGAVVPGVSGPLRADATVDQREDGAFAIALDASGPYAADFAAEAVLGGPDPARATAEVSVPNLAPLVPALQGPLEAEIAAEQQADGAWEVDVDADGPFASTLAAEAALGPGGGPVDATLSLRVPNVAPIVPRFPGALTVDATVRQSAGAPLQVQANVSGPLGLTADAEGRIGEGEGRVRFDAAVPDIAPIAPGLSGALSVRGSATQRQDAWAVDLQTSGPGAASTRVAGTVDPGGTADLSITGSAPLGLLNGLLAPQRLDGDVTADLRLNGPLGLDSLSGTLSTQGTRLAIPAINQAIENIDLTATLGGGQIALQGSAASAAGGGLSLSGPITLAPGFPADLAIDFDQMVVEDPALFRTELGGTLTVTGPLQGTGGVIGGRVTATPTELRIPSGSVGFSGNIPRVQHVNEPAGVRLTRQRAGLVNERREARGGAPGRTVFGLDLTIDAPNRVFLRGRGLDVELGGSFRIGGTTRNPAPVGGIEVIRGRLDILGRRLELEDDGQIVLGGNLVPFLELTATSDDLDDFTIVISIEGPVDSPEFTFSSNPPLPQDEVLARFFFGRGLADLSPLQAAQLAASIARLTGRGGDGLLSGLREGLGVDDFNLVTDDEGDAALQIGTYLSENIYTDVTTSTGGQTEVNLNIDVTDNVTVQGSADNEGETSLGIFFQRDY